MDWYYRPDLPPPPELVQPGDIWLYGNHDPYAPGWVEARHFLRIGKYFICHGDAFDIQWIFYRLGRRYPGVRREHAFKFYQALVSGSKWYRAISRYLYQSVRGIPHIDDWRIALLAPIVLTIGVLGDAPPFLGRTDPGPDDYNEILPSKPETWESRFLTMYPDHYNAQYVIFGHYHRWIKESKGERHFIGAPSWVKGTNNGYVVLEDGQLILVEI